MQGSMVRLSGRNFTLEIDGKLERVGFFATVCVEDLELSRLKRNALQELSERISRKNIGCLPGRASIVFLEEYGEVEKFPDPPPDGFTFYTMRWTDRIKGRIRFAWWRYRGFPAFAVTQ